MPYIFLLETHLIVQPLSHHERASGGYDARWVPSNFPYKGGRRGFAIKTQSIGFAGEMTWLRLCLGEGRHVIPMLHGFCCCFEYEREGRKVEGTQTKGDGAWVKKRGSAGNRERRGERVL